MKQKISTKKSVTYIIMDGWGIAPKGPGNAISLAKTPNIDRLKKEYLYTEIGAGGESIGLTKGHQGSSEIGHFIIGAGRNVKIPQTIVLDSVKKGEIFKNKAYLGAINHAKKNKSTLHLVGLMSDKGVHSYDIVLHVLIEVAVKNGVHDIVVHFVSDGRDAGPYSAQTYLTRLEKVFKKYKAGRVGSVMGRYWIMDRDHRWKRVEKGYNAIVNGASEFKASSAKEAIKNAYSRAGEAEKNRDNFVESDEFIKPTVIVDKDGEAVGKLKDKDALIWVNFRTDRSIEATQALTEAKFDKFKRAKKPDIFFAGTFKYYDKMKAPYAFEREFPKNTFGEMVSKAGLKQFRVTETEKWIYVTTVFSGMRSNPFKGEDRVLIPSDRIVSYDLKPKMHALDIATEAIKAINTKKYELVFLNLNNPDIIGHTGKIDKAITGIEACDKAVGQVVDAVLENGGLAVISADHGNAEVMLTKKGEMDTNHTANDVPFIVVNDDPEYDSCSLKAKGALKDVTPTILDILNVKKPKEMTGESLLTRCMK